MIKTIQQSFTVQFNYAVHFTEGLFTSQNTLLADTLRSDGNTRPRKVLFVLDAGVRDAHPELTTQIAHYVQQHEDVFMPTSAPLVLPGGEVAKNDPNLLEEILNAVNEQGICRHSYLIAIGGGAVLDLAGFAASVAHRGVRLIRVPTTVLAQNDSGMGVKNGVNAFGKKNFLGAFTPPYAVLNDSDFLKTMSERDWRSGISEAIKVALIKDAAFYNTIKQSVPLLLTRNMEAMQEQIYICAAMHLNHIAGRDPFEKGSSRPLDFGHWAAHKLEQLTNYSLRHGEAVATGIAIDATYSYLKGMLSQPEWENIIDLIRDLGFDLFVPEMNLCLDAEGKQLVLSQGLTEFREHLGGELTITLLEGIGKGVEVHEIDNDLLTQSIELLYQCHKKVAVQG
jgi:3-dehydroquinate synthase